MLERQESGRSSDAPLLDRESVKKIIQDELAVHLAGTPALVHLQMLVGPRAADAVAELARPMPTQAELTDWLREIFTADPAGTPWGVAAEELLLLLKGEVS